MYPVSRNPKQLSCIERITKFKKKNYDEGVQTKGVGIF